MRRNWIVGLVLIGATMALSACGQPTNASPSPTPTHTVMTIAEWIPEPSFFQTISKSDVILVVDLVSSETQEVKEAVPCMSSDDPDFTYPTMNPYYDPDIPGSGCPSSDSTPDSWIYTYSTLAVTEVIRGNYHVGSHVILAQNGGVRGGVAEIWTNVAYLDQTDYRHFVILASVDPSGVLHPSPQIPHTYGIWVVDADDDIWPLPDIDGYPDAGAAGIGTPDLDVTDRSWYPSTLDDIRTLA